MEALLERHFADEALTAAIAAYCSSFPAHDAAALKSDVAAVSVCAAASLRALPRWRLC
jgi:hypothetical protein